MNELVEWMIRDAKGDPVFYAAGGIALLGGLGVVTRRNPIYSAISMLVSFLALAVVYLLLQAPFLAAMHVLVYTGAILVLFLFVIMLLNLKPEELGQEYPLPTRGAVAALCLGLFGLLAAPALLDPSLRGAPAAVEGNFGSVEAVGNALFRNPYALSFELSSALILVAIFGGVVLAKKKL